ncbi:N-acetyllactosaminide 3-alpha-galactosyltransferase [Teladorsagia circumcincta]|uniref:Hexosyltransferase n=1 Tax=Teladorsagia circumcincta TaxID=45464 RepID=A0A2G9U3T4_TELCI|nr:N-acetyllactosaminide 3-alpha-galactosyltransferase [Teladorsagia circumcincta]
MAKAEHPSPPPTEPPLHPPPPPLPPTISTTREPRSPLTRSSVLPSPSRPPPPPPTTRKSKPSFIQPCTPPWPPPLRSLPSTTRRPKFTHPSPTVSIFKAEGQAIDKFTTRAINCGYTPAITEQGHDSNRHPHRHRDDRNTSTKKKSFAETIFVLYRLAVVNYSIVPGSRSCHGLHYFVIVHTRADDRLTREKWRSTYGQLQHQFNFNIIFVTGLSQRESLNNELRTEAATHGDILQGHFIDSYRNLTMKNVAALRYVAAVCPTVQAVVKLDDDVAWNIQNTKRIVDDAIRDQRIYCPLHVSMKEYSETHYPPHCSGLAYAMPRSAYFSILGAVNKERYFWVTQTLLGGCLETSIVIRLEFTRASFLTAIRRENIIAVADSDKISTSSGFSW